MKMLSYFIITYWIDIIINGIITILPLERVFNVTVHNSDRL